jgi:NTE family protein
MYDKPKLGLALSGGGARGLAHIGVLKVLEANNTQVDFLSGTSMGGVIAAAYAAGLCPDEIEQIALSFRSSRDMLKLADPDIPSAGLFRGDQLLKFFKGHIGDLRFDQLDIPLGLVAVDIKTGNEVHFFEGSVSEALRASVSVPGLLSPIDHGEQRLVDGGLLNNLPVDVTYEMGADIVLAVDVMTATSEASFWQILGERRMLPGKIGEIISVLGDSLNILIQQQNLRKLEQAPPTFLLQPQISQQISVVSGYHRVPELVEEGISVAEEIIEELKEHLQIANKQVSI